MTNTIRKLGSIGTRFNYNIKYASKNFQPTMSDYQGMDKKKWQDKYKSMLCFMVIIQGFICRYYYIHQFIAYILIKSKKKVKAEAKLQND